MEPKKSNESADKKSSATKKPYVSPKLEALGSFVDLTQAELSVGMGIDG